jgi:hypothetical protein
LSGGFLGHLSGFQKLEWLFERNIFY